MDNISLRGGGKIPPCMIAPGLDEGLQLTDRRVYLIYLLYFVFKAMEQIRTICLQFVTTLIFLN